MIFVGEVFSLFILAVAAIETAIALCIILSYYRLTNKTYNISRNNDIFFSGAVFLSVQKWNTGVVISIVPAFYFILGMIVGVINIRLWKYYWCCCRNTASNYTFRVLAKNQYFNYAIYTLLFGT